MDSIHPRYGFSVPSMCHPREEVIGHKYAITHNITGTGYEVVEMYLLY